MPPLTSIIAPFMYLAFSDTKKAAVSAISSGKPKSPNGIRLATASLA